MALCPLEGPSERLLGGEQGPGFLAARACVLAGSGPCGLGCIAAPLSFTHAPPHSVQKARLLTSPSQSHRNRQRNGVWPISSLRNGPQPLSIVRKVPLLQSELCGVPSHPLHRLFFPHRPNGALESCSFARHNLLQTLYKV